MLRPTRILVLAAVLATGAAIGVAACGEDREGEVNIETSGTETTGTTGTETTGTEATETEVETEIETVTEAVTAPETVPTETESDGGTSAP